MASTQKSRTRPANGARASSGGAAAKSPRARTAPTPEPPPSTASKLRAPLMAGGAAIAGIVGGVLLSSKVRPRKRSLPGLPKGLDFKNVDMKKTRKQVGRASMQFGELTRELRKAGEQAERIGEALK
jgi:hypothetical protein